MQNTFNRENVSFSDNKRTNNATVIGLVTGFLGVLAILMLTGYCVWKLRKQRRKEEKEFCQ
jgi:hypothetical protein